MSKTFEHGMTRRQLLGSLGTLGGGAAATALCGTARSARAAAGLSTPIDVKNLIVAFAHNGPISDEGWTTTHHRGKLAVEKAYPGITTQEVESIPYSAEATRIFTQFCVDGASMIIDSSSSGDLLNAALDKFPDVAVLECAGRTPSANQNGYYIAHWYPAYLIGMAAGLLSKTHRIGYVSAFPVRTVKTNVSAFHLGAVSVNPKVQTQVISINSWFDPQGAAQAGSALIDAGCDFLFGIMDEAAYLQVAEKRGIWAAMWNTDVRQYGPNSYVSSLLLDWDAYYVTEVGKRIKGTWTGGRTDLLPLGAGTDRDTWGDKVPKEVAAQVDETREKMLKGFNPFVGPLTDNKGTVQVADGIVMKDMDLFNVDWVVAGVAGI
jgi:basic membrane protein A